MAMSQYEHTYGFSDLQGLGRIWSKASTCVVFPEKKKNVIINLFIFWFMILGSK